MCRTAGWNVRKTGNTVIKLSIIHLVKMVPPKTKYSPVVKEAAQLEVIGAIALGLVVAVAAVIVAADVPALMVAVRRLRDIITTW